MPPSFNYNHLSPVQQHIMEQIQTICSVQPHFNYEPTNCYCYFCEVEPEINFCVFFYYTDDVRFKYTLPTHNQTTSITVQGEDFDLIIVEEIIHSISS